jgi:hypothetical protein
VVHGPTPRYGWMGTALLMYNTSSAIFPQTKFNNGLSRELSETYDIRSPPVFSYLHIIIRERRTKSLLRKMMVQPQRLKFVHVNIWNTWQYLTTVIYNAQNIINIILYINLKIRGFRPVINIQYIPFYDVNKLYNIRVTTRLSSFYCASRITGCRVLLFVSNLLIKKSHIGYWILMLILC